MANCANTNSNTVREEKADVKYAECKSRIACVPQKNDVLLGRGGRTRDHEGNVYFRSLVSKNKKRYRSERLRFDRRYIAARIYRAVKKRDGRFLLDLENNEQWFEITKKKAVDKTAQALREKDTNTNNEKKAVTLPIAYLNEMMNDSHRNNLISLPLANLPDTSQSMPLKLVGKKSKTLSGLIERETNRCLKTGDENYWLCEHYNKKMSIGKVEQLLTQLIPATVSKNNPRNLARKGAGSLSEPAKNVESANKFEDRRDIMNFHSSRINCHFPSVLDSSISDDDISDSVEGKVVCSNVDGRDNLPIVSTDTENQSHIQGSFQDQINRHVIAPISYIGQSFINKSFETESKDVYELVASLKDKGEDASLYLPTVIAQLCKRVIDLETNH